MQDAKQILSNAQAITASAASTNVFDFESARDVGAGGFLNVICDVNTVFATLTSLQVSLQVSTDNSTFYDMMMGPAVVAANLLAGLRLFRLVIPPKGPNMFSGTNLVPPRYLRLYYTVAGSNATTGKVDAWLAAAEDMQQISNYAANYTAA